MATRFVLLPGAAEFGATGFAQLTAVNTTFPRPVLAFDASSSESAFWTFVAPQGLTAPLTLVVSYIMASATSGDVVLTGALEAVTDGDTTDLDATTSVDTSNISAATTVPGTAGYLDQLSITLTNNDSIAAGDYVRLRLLRFASDAGDTAAGDLLALAIELRDSA